MPVWRAHDGMALRDASPWHVRTGRAVTPLVILVAAIVFLPGVRADWLQTGGDAARHSEADGVGPVWSDVALKVNLHGVRAPASGPLIIGKNVYVATSNVTDSVYATSDENNRSTASPNMVWRINLDSGIPERFVNPGPGIVNLAGDGKLLFVQHQGGVTAFALPEGTKAWDWSPKEGNPATVPGEEVAACPGMAATPGRLFLGCIVSQADRQDVGYGIAASIDTSTGAEVWRWSPENADAILNGQQPLSVVNQPVQTRESGVHAISVIPPHVFVEVRPVASVNADPARDPTQRQFGGAGEIYIQALGMDDGSPAYRFATTTDDKFVRYDTFCDSPNMATPPAGDQLEAFFKLNGELYRLNPANGILLDPPVSLQNDDIGPGEDWGNLPIVSKDTNGAVYVPSIVKERKMVRGDGFSSAALSTETDGNETWNRMQVLAGRHVYTSSSVRESWTHDSTSYNDIVDCAAVGNNYGTIRHLAIRSLNSTDLASEWRYDLDLQWATRMPPDPNGLWIAPFAVSNGTLVLATIDGVVTVLGHTPTSLIVVPHVSNQAPEPGENITVDLGNSVAGKTGGPPTSFRVDWGDGTPAEWGSPSSFRHSFSFGRAVARFEVRNAEGQSSSSLYEFQVGGGQAAATPPPAAVIVQPQIEWLMPAAIVAAAALILVAVLAAMIALRRRRQDVFRREMDAVQRAYDQLRAQPVKCEAAMAERKVRARALLFESKLAPALYTALLSRIDELTKGLYLAGGKTAPALQNSRFRIIRELGRGSTSRALLANDTVLDRHVVLKQPLVPWLSDAKVRQQFMREARALARLRHPNVVTLHEVMEENGVPVLVLEWVDGGSLADRLHKGVLSIPEAVRVATDVLNGLDRMHAAGLVHRDLKPANILIDKHGTAKVSDLGIARPPPGASAAATATQGARPGSPAYMSPEQARGGTVDARTDLYAMAAILYEALTGRAYLTLTDETGGALVRAIETARPLFEARLVPHELAGIIARGLAKEPARRFTSADEMARALTDAFSRTKPQAGKAQSGKAGRQRAGRTRVPGAGP